MRAMRHRPFLLALTRHISIRLALGQTLLFCLCGAVQPAAAHPVAARLVDSSPHLGRATLRGRRSVATCGEFRWGTVPTCTQSAAVAEIATGSYVANANAGFRSRWTSRSSGKRTRRAPHGLRRNPARRTVDTPPRADTGWSGDAKKKPSSQPQVVQLIGSDSIPPTITITPASGSTGTSPLNITIVWCDAASSLTSTSRHIYLNSAEITSQFTYVAGTHTGCTGYATSTGSVTLVSGSNTLNASIADNNFNVGSASRTYNYSAPSYGVSVTPDGQPKTVLAGLTNSVNFTVANTGNVDELVNLTAICTGTASGCPSSLSPITVPYQGSKTVTISFNGGLGGDTGTVRLRASYSGNSSVADSGSYKVTAQWQTFLVLSQSFLSDAENASLCANNCFAATYSQSTVPYYSLDTPRNVTLLYNSHRVLPRPFLYADVYLKAGAYTTAQQYLLEARIGGANVSFTNGDTKLHFAVNQSNPQKTVRLAGQLDLGTYATGAYPVDVIVTAQYSDHNEQTIVHDRVLVVNARESPIAQGWSIAGIQRLYIDQSDGSALIVDGAGDAKYFHCTSGTVPCAAGGFQSPDHTRLRIVSVLGNPVYYRDYPDSSHAQFDATGRSTQVYDRFFNQVIYEYDALGRVSKIRDPYRAGGFAETCLWYGNSWGIDSIREPGADNSPCTGRKTTIVTSTDSTLASIQGPDGRSTHFTYDSNARMTAVIGSHSDTTRYAYDPASWTLDSIISPRIPVDTAGSGITAMLSSVVRYTPWQERGVPRNLTTTTPYVPIVPESVYAVITDPEHHQTRYTVDSLGQPLRTTDPLGRITTITRVRGKSVSIVYPSGVKDSIKYNSDDLPIYTSRTGQPATAIIYGTYGLPTSISKAGQPTLTYIYGQYGRDSVETFADAITTYTTDTRGRVVKKTDPSGHVTLHHYDSKFGNLDSSSVVDSLGNIVKATKTTFDSYGRDSVSWATGGTAKTTIYDVANSVVRTVVPGPGTGMRATTIVNDTIGGSVMKDAKGQFIRDSLNAIGWVVKKIDPTGQAVSYSYNRDGMITRYVNRRGQAVTQLYDAMHRDTLRSGSGIVTAHFSYNTAGTVIKGWNSTSSEEVYLNPATGWRDSTVTVLTGGHRFRRQYMHDSKMRLDSVDITGPGVGGSVGLHGRHFEWNDSTGLLTAITAGSMNISMQYNSEFLPSVLTYSGNSSQTAQYTADHRPYSLSFTSQPLWNRPPDTLLTFQYGYDSLGKVVENDRLIKGGGSLQIARYSFDELGQLAWMGGAHTNGIASCPEPSGHLKIDFGVDCWNSVTKVKDRSIAFTYDSVGNMRLWYDTTHSYWTQGTYTTGNRLTYWANNTYTYDLDGNRATKTKGASTVRYHWTPDGLLDSVIAGPSHIGYAYNAFGRLVSRSRNGTVERYFIWDADELLAELDGNWQLVAEYVHALGGAPLAVFTGPSHTLRLFANDGIGNVAGVFDASGVVERLVYSPWGRTDSLFTSLADTNRIRWKGLLWEGDSTNLYYARARWYDPASNRFMSEDPAGIVGGINPYLFGANDGINHNDPSGMLWDADCWMGIYDCIQRSGGASFPSHRGVCSFYLPCNDGPIASIGFDGKSVFSYPDNSSAAAKRSISLTRSCTNFTTDYCLKVWESIGRLIRGPGACAALGYDAAYRLGQNTLLARYGRLDALNADGTVRYYDVYGLHSLRGVIVIAERAFKEGGDVLFITLAHEEAHAVWRLPDNKDGEPYYLNMAEQFAISCQTSSPVR